MSTTKYVDVQGRMYPTGIHIQGKGPVVNRNYGVALTMTVPPELSAWVDAQAAQLKSLAGTTAKYIPIKAGLLDDKRIHMTSGKASFYVVDDGEELQTFLSKFPSTHIVVDTLG